MATGMDTPKIVFVDIGASEIGLPNISFARFEKAIISGDSNGWSKNRGCEGINYNGGCFI